MRWLFFSICAVFSLNGFSQWVENTLINTPVCTQFGKQNDVRLEGNGHHGAFLVWKDARESNVNPDIYIQQLDSTGLALWNQDGVALCTDSSDQSTPNLCTDMNDGVIVAWSDERNGGVRDVYAQRIGTNGQVLWTMNGVPIANKSIREHNEKIASDDNGGAYIFWEQYDSLIGVWDIWGQHINGNGQRLWDVNGVPASIIPGTQMYGDRLNVKLQKDGQGGVFVVWQDFRNLLDHDIYAQHFDATGNRLWGEGGLGVCMAAGTQNNPKIDPDSVHSGIYVAWADGRNGLDYDIYAQSIDFNGNASWNPNGVAVCDQPGNQSAVDIVSTTSIEGVVLVWKDGRNGLTDIYAQKLAPTGLNLWNDDGIPVSVSPFAQINPNICSDGDGGVIIAWQDSTINDWDVKSQRLDAMGNNLWMLNGVVVSDAIEIQGHPKNIPDGNGGSIYAWQDKRANQYDIYAHHLNKNGNYSSVRETLDLAIKVLAYPNPFHDEVMLRLPPMTQQLEVYNMLGEHVYQSSGMVGNEMHISLMLQEMGTYTVVCKGLYGRRATPIVKQ
jgi:hypothetical protein